jgi:two-component system CheB/CheR fusion protein
MAEKVLNLIPGDVDRAIGHINPNIDAPNLEQLIVECMETVSAVEREVQDREGRWYSLRIRPYKSLDNKIDGAVLALIDVNVLKQSEQRVAAAQQFADLVIETSPQPVAVLGPDLRVRQVNAAFAALLSLSSEEIRGRVLPELAGPLWKLDEWTDQRVSAGTSVPTVKIPPDPSGRWQQSLRVAGRVLPSPEDPESTALLVTVAPAEGM